MYDIRKKFIDLKNSNRINDINRMVSIIFENQLVDKSLSFNTYLSEPKIKFDDYEEKFIDNNWTTETKNNGKIFNGKLLNFDKFSFNIEDNLIKLFFSYTDYKHFIGARKLNNESYDKLVIPLTVSCIIETADNMITIGTRGNNKNLWQIAGGMFDPDQDIINGEPSFIGCIERENSEELCKLDIYNYKFLGIFIHYGYRFATLVYSAHCKESSEEIKFKHNEEDKTIIDFNELPEIEFIKVNQDFLEKIQKQYRVVGSTLTAMLLYWNYRFRNNHRKLHEILNYKI